MTDKIDDQLIKNQINNRLPLSLFLALIMGFPFLNLRMGETPVKIPILGFHGITKAKNPILADQQADIDYPQAELEKLLEYLIIHDYWFLTSQDLYDYFLTKSKAIPPQHRGQKAIMLTFDDGYKTVYTNLLPVLSKLEKKYNKKIKVVLFINPGHLANEQSIASTKLSCPELRAGFKKDFFDIQSHGENHLDLTKLSQQKIFSELLLSRIKLRKCLQDLDPDQKVAAHLAYPYGAYNKLVEQYVKKYYLSAYLYNDETLNYSCLKNSYQIPRLMVYSQRKSQEVIKIIQELSVSDKSKTKC
ncbi:MAG TPA: polysaccharide deacetylase family protein [Nostocaceae cyanobacterium]|nr:polysaccharide deacetylase family protein [Nostocaceae cyanobacterium]